MIGKNTARGILLNQTEIFGCLNRAGSVKLVFQFRFSILAGLLITIFIRPFVCGCAAYQKGSWLYFISSP